MFGDDTFNFGEMLRPEQFGLAAERVEGTIGFSVLDSIQALAMMIEQETVMSERMGHIAKVTAEAFMPKAIQGRSEIVLDEQATIVRDMAAGNSLGLGASERAQNSEILRRNDEMHATIVGNPASDVLAQPLTATDPISKAREQLARVHSKNSNDPYMKTPSDPFIDDIEVATAPKELQPKESRTYNTEEQARIDELHQRINGLHAPKSDVASAYQAANEQFALGA